MKKLISLVLFIAIGFVSIGSYVNAEDNTYKYLNKSIIEKLDNKIDSMKGNKTKSLILLIGKVDKLIKIEKNEIKKSLYSELNVYLKLKKKSYEEKVVDETANWKTYINTEYGYEIKYPQNWNYKIENNGACFRENGKTYLIEESYRCAIFISESTSVNTKRLSVQDWIKMKKDLAGAIVIEKKNTNYDLAQYQAYDYLGTETIIYNIGKDGLYINFSAPNFGDKSLNLSVNSIYDKMLTTFKLTDLNSSIFVKNIDAYTKAYISDDKGNKTLIDVETKLLPSHKVIVQEGIVVIENANFGTFKLNKYGYLEADNKLLLKLNQSDLWINAKKSFTIDTVFSKIKVSAGSVISISQNEALSTIYVISGSVEVSNLVGRKALLGNLQKLTISMHDASDKDIDLSLQKDNIDEFFTSGEWYIKNFNK